MLVVPDRIGFDIHELSRNALGCDRLGGHKGVLQRDLEVMIHSNPNGVTTIVSAKFSVPTLNFGFVLMTLLAMDSRRKQRTIQSGRLAVGTSTVVDCRLDVQRADRNHPDHRHTIISTWIIIAGIIIAGIIIAGIIIAGIIIAGWWRRRWRGSGDGRSRARSPTQEFQLQDLQQL